jgi:CheY-like chemotaxis protein
LSDQSVPNPVCSGASQGEEDGDPLLSNDVVLIVDDSKFIAQAYSRVLLGLGYRVLIACDGKTGLFAAESCHPSIILLDMLMPDMDGVEVLRTLGTRPGNCAPTQASRRTPETEWKARMDIRRTEGLLTQPR